MHVLHPEQGRHACRLQQHLTLPLLRLRRLKSASKRRIASDGGYDIEAGQLQGKDHGVPKARREELLSCVPSKLDTERLRSVLHGHGST